jgi:hypothetical protein
VSGIILGLDTDKPDSGSRLLEFIERSEIPMLTINLLQALPKTPLWDRLEREGRLVHDDGRDSNVDFLLPYDEVVASWKHAMAVAYAPEKVYARYQYQCDNVYVRRVKMPVPDEMKTWPNIRRGLVMLRNIFWKVGVLGDYRRVFWKFALGRIKRGLIMLRNIFWKVGVLGDYKRVFWKFAWGRLKRGDIEGLIGPAMIAHHLITFARAATSGRQNASNYSLRLREASVPAE